VGALHEPFLTPAAHGIDDVVTLRPLLDEDLDSFGSVLEIGVHQDDRLARGLREPCLERSLMPEIAREVKDLQVGIVLVEAVEDIGRAVGAAVVDEHDLERAAADALQDGDEARHELGEAFALVVDGNDDRQARAHHWPYLRPSRALCKLSERTVT